ncbi:UNVERIFIED_CONTAM: hypothetical protein HDU68_000462 [Siphonaria sp. JEL0065]|nr:hypothetical protein HDU68_000462 [Siphonaria sp. JEL0065]
MSLSQVPRALSSLVNLNGVGFHNALYGSQILTALYDYIQTPLYFQNLNVSGSPNFMNDPKRVLNGTLPQLPLLPKASGYYAMGFSYNNLTGNIPSNYGDSLLQFNVSNNPLLSGPLPLSSGNPGWYNTKSCELHNTQLCILSTWAHQPSCIRDTSKSLPVCGGAGTTPSIDPSDPNSPYRSNILYSELVFAMVLTFICFLYLMSYLRRRRAAQGDQIDYDYGYYGPNGYGGGRGGNDVELLRVRPPAEEPNLPTYMPAAPAYTEQVPNEQNSKKDDSKKQ